MDVCNYDCLNCKFSDCIVPVTKDDFLEESRKIESDICQERAGKVIKGSGLSYGSEGRERVLSRMKEYYQREGEKRLAYQKEYYKKKREERLAYQKARYWRKREELLEYQKAYNKAVRSSCNDVML